MKKKDYEAQAQEIIKMAEESGLQANYFFTTTFNRYLVQLKILDELEKEIDEAGALVTKEYVKGRENIYTNPAISAYNKTADTANKTVTTLLKIIQGFKGDAVENETDPLLELINGADNESV